LPLAGQLPAHAAETAAGNIVFDGKHLPDVAWDKIRVISVGSAAATPWLQLPQLITFAELVDDGRTLVAVSGTELHVLDAATMKARRPSIELPATPIRFTIDATGRHAILTFGRNGDSGFREQIESFDLGADRAAPAKASASGPLRQLQLSGDGTLLVAVGFGSGATEIFDAVTLHRIGVYPHDPERPVLRAGLTSDRRAWLVTRDAVETESDIGDLLLWNPASDKIEEQRKLKGVFPVGLGTFGDIPVLAAKDRIVLDAGAAHARSSARLFQGESTTLFAFSHDHRLIAHAFGHDVYLYDAATMVPVSAPLHTDMGVVDVIMQLAFATDDRSLLCRTSAKKWFVWAIASDRRPAAELRYDADQLVAEGSGQRLLRGVDMQEKRRLRARDPGPWPQAEVRPRPPAARHIVGVPVPVRRVGLDPLMLDLTDFYTSAPGSSYNPFDSVMPNMDGMAFGEPRFEGIDYDLRGGVELRWGVGGRMGSHTVVALSAAARGIRVPPVPVAAFDLIMVAPLPIPVDDEKVYADLRVHYRDGSTALLPMRTNREIPGLNGRDRHIRSIGEEGQDPLPLIGELQPRMNSNPRLPNPQPEKQIDTLDIETSRERWSAFVVLAITAEPVIPGAQPRSPTAEGDAARARRDPESRHSDRR
jgi:hypothetical protein